MDHMNDPLNSPFVSSFISALAGAFAGAIAAYLIARISEVRKDRLSSLRSSNNAVVLATTCANMAMSLKSQHIRPLVHNFLSNLASFEAEHEAAVLDNRPAHFKVEADLTSITPITLPIDALKSYVYSMNVTEARAVSAIAQLEQSLSELNSAIEIRELAIKEFKQTKFRSADESLHKLFGTVNEDGDTDALYSTTVQAIGQYTDDVIFFSVFLAEILTKHARYLHQNLHRIRSKIPAPHTVDFSMARCQALVPEDMEYEKWLHAISDRIQ